MSIQEHWKRLRIIQEAHQRANHNERWRPLDTMQTATAGPDNAERDALTADARFVFVTVAWSTRWQHGQVAAPPCPPSSHYTTARTIAGPHGKPDGIDADVATGIRREQLTLHPSIATIHAALEAGITGLNTGDWYGMGYNEMLIGDALRGRRREQAVISVKFAHLRDPAGQVLGQDTRPAAVKTSRAYTLRRLRTDYVDIYRPARLGPRRPS